MHISLIRTTLSQPYLKSTKFHYLRNPIDLSDQMVMDHHWQQYLSLCRKSIRRKRCRRFFVKLLQKYRKSVDIRGQVVGVGPLLDTLKQKYPKIEFVGC